jgi:hypothetical protein
VCAGSAASCATLCRRRRAALPCASRMSPTRRPRPRPYPSYKVPRPCPRTCVRSPPPPQPLISDVCAAWWVVGLRPDLSFEVRPGHNLLIMGPSGIPPFPLGGGGRESTTQNPTGQHCEATRRAAVVAWWLVAGGWRLVAVGWWLVAGGWRLLVVVVVVAWWWLTGRRAAAAWWRGQAVARAPSCESSGVFGPQSAVHATPPPPQPRPMMPPAAAAAAARPASATPSLMISAGAVWVGIWGIWGIWVRVV